MTVAVASPAEILADFEFRSRRYETPFNDGVVVWHSWGEGPPLLMLHGAHGSWAHWIRNIDDLAKHRQVIAPDLPGFGESVTPPQPLGESIADGLIEGLNRTLASDAVLDVVGFSLGGVIATHLAAQAPERVRRLVIVDSGGLDTPHGHMELLPTRGLQGEERIKVRRHNLMQLMIRDPERADDLALLIQETYGRMARVDALSIVAPDKLVRALPRVKAQVDTIWGELDQPHPDPALQLEALRKVKPDVQMGVIPGAGHWAMYEGGPVFNRMLEAMLDQPLRT